MTLIQGIGAFMVFSVCALIVGLTVACEGWKGALVIWGGSVLLTAVLIGGLVLMGLR